MFRLNFWARPFFPPPQMPDNEQHQGQELLPAPPFLPGPMHNQLMLLAASERQQRELRSMDKDQPVFSAPFPVLRQGELPMFAPMMPFLQPGLRAMNPNYRPMDDGAKRSPELVSPVKRNDEDGGPTVKDGTVTPNSVYDVSSDVLSESGESEGRWTPDENGRPVKRARKRAYQSGECPICPICGVSVKPSDLQSHVSQELERLQTMSRRYTRRSSSRDGSSPSPVLYRPHLSPSTSAVNNGASSAGADQQTAFHNGSTDSGSHLAANNGTNNVVAAAQARFETYQRVRNNRQARLAAKTRCRKPQRRPLEDSQGRPLMEGPSQGRPLGEAQCPVCSARLSGTAEQLNEHVELCLKKSRAQERDEDGVVDVDGDSSFEEYTWAGQTRVRAASMLDGGYKGAGFVVVNKTSDDEDVNLDVDGDDSDVYGKPQYSEADIIPCRSEETQSDEERERLRGEYMKTAVNQVQSEPSERSRWISENDCSEPSSSGLDLSMGSHEHDHDNGLSSTEDSASSREEVIESLRNKIREQAALLEKKDTRFKCLICMDQFTIPLVSIQCWHVHCEECWLRTLGAKKLCPQCNMITSPSDLRKVYL